MALGRFETVPYIYFNDDGLRTRGYLQEDDLMIPRLLGSE